MPIDDIEFEPQMAEPFEITINYGRVFEGVFAEIFGPALARPAPEENDGD